MRQFGWRTWLMRQVDSACQARGHRRRAGRAARPRLEALEDRTVPATLTWNGSVDANWSDTGLSSFSTTVSNWTNSDGSNTGAVPQAGDDLVFPAGAANLASNNDLNGLSVHSINFQDGGYTLGGNPLTVTGSLSDQSADGGANAVQLDLTLLNTVQVAVADSSRALSLTGAIGGTGGLIESGAGGVLLSGTNDYAGGTDITAGTAIVQADNALGTGPVTVEAGAALEIRANLAQNPFMTIPNDVTLNGSGVGGTGALRNTNGFNTLTGTITLQSDSTVSTEVGELTFSGQVVGDHGLTKVGPTFLHLGGSAANTYTGPTTVDAGFLSLEKDTGVVAVPGDLVIGNGTGTPGSPTTVQLQTDGEIADTSRVTVASDGLLDINGLTETIGSLAGTGQVNLTAEGDLVVPGTLTVGANNTGTTYAGVIGGDGGSLIKVGGGTFTLAGANTYTGTTTVNGGTLLVDGAQPGSTVMVNVGGTLGGHGSVGPLTANAGGVVSPGDSPGILLIQGGATFNPGSVLLAELDGPAPGSGYDQLNVAGPVVLSGPTLLLEPGFTPSPGQDFVLIANNGSGPVQGTFAGAPEDALLRHGSAFFDISYVGGRGSDVDVRSQSRGDLFVRALFATFDAPSTRATRAPFEAQVDGGQSLLAVAENFLASPARRLAEVDQFYSTLGLPNDGRQGFYLAQLAAGVPAGRVLLEMLKSPGFRHQHHSNAAFVRALFTGLLGRPPGRHDVLGHHPMSFYVGELSAGAVSRVRLVEELLSSDEVYTAAVKENFETLLGTEPTAAELQTLTGQVVSGGLTPDSLSASVVTLASYVDTFLARAAAGKVPGVALVNV
jgi:autotransporter-associated beta strand protein